MITFAVAASAVNVSADGFRLPDQDAFATARGEAFATTADNASAIYYNPAGISQLKGGHFRCGIYGSYTPLIDHPVPRDSGPPAPRNSRTPITNVVTVNHEKNLLTDSNGCEKPNARKTARFAKE